MMSPRSHARTRTITSGVADWPAAFDNSLLRDLRAEPRDSPPHTSRTVIGAHCTLTRPTVEAPSPQLAAYSLPAAEELGLGAADCESDEFLRIFSGSPPDEFACWTTVYGASFNGGYGGQRGDGRAISIGQLHGREV